MLNQLFYLYALVVLVTSLTCGENCPTNTCTECWCGIQTYVIDIPMYCEQYDWNQECCKCIISRQSKGNGNAMSQLGTNPPKGPLTGLWQLNELIRQLTCGLPNKQSLCSPSVNTECAFKSFQINGRRFERVWQASANACGCAPKQN